MRARGLKQRQIDDMLKEKAVAPHAGAWVETRKAAYQKWHDEVAPHVGAWVETIMLSMTQTEGKGSRPMRARGLKLRDWKSSHQTAQSRPMRARGLKLLMRPDASDAAMSRPMRARGLKLRLSFRKGFREGRAPCGRVG